MLYATSCEFTASDIEEWMWERAATRVGYYSIEVPYKDDEDVVIKRRVNLSQKEYAILDKVVTNQIMAESKTKVFRPIVYSRNIQLWDDGTEDSVVMRVLAPWAVAHYKCQPHKHWESQFSGLAWYCARVYCWILCVLMWAFFGWPAVRPFPWIYTKEHLRTRLIRIGSTDEGSCIAATSSDAQTKQQSLLKRTDSTFVGGFESSTEGSKAAKKNKLGYQDKGESYINEHPGGGNDEEDSEIRAAVEGRIIRKECGVGVVGQSTDDKGRKQICGVLSQPISVEPNVYAQELWNAIKAIEERINKKQRPYAGNQADELKIKRMVYCATQGKRNAPFSAKKVLDLIHTMVYEEIKSNKWPEGRVDQAIESLCREIDPQFKLKAAVKLEPMQEGKAPRLLIADEDRGQVMALMTIYCIESLIKKHFPEKGIKGLSKKDAIKRVMKACRVPRKVAKQMVTIFEGDGSAWDTTCSARIRELVENPVINHVANLVNGFMYASPSQWADAHASICAQNKLDISYTKNKEFQKITIDAIRRSGHRGTSCLNWWMNFVCWHCAVFEEPELFLDPSHRYGTDVTGTTRWMNSAFEGDDSFLVTSPKIEEGKSLHIEILQFWERIGFNMKIEIRNKRALFVGYYIGLDGSGPLFDEKKDEWMMVPEIDRCFTRAGTSCSPSMIEAFKAGDRNKCIRLAGAAAMSRAFEFAGLAPTISNKFLQYAIDCDFEITHDLKMRTHQEFDDKNELIDHIRVLNGTCQNEDKILMSTGFWSSDEEKNRFVDFMWHYDQLVDWEGFRDSLPQSWRQ